MTDLALTKLDVLDNFREIMICSGYHLPGDNDHLWHYWELDAEQLQVCVPVQIKLQGWQSQTSGMKRFDQLPAQAQAYVRKIEELVETPVRYVSVGPERDATIEI